MTGALRGLYVLTDPSLTPPGTMVRQVTGAIEGGARLVQYRDKHHAAGKCREIAAELHGVCRAHEVPLIINDDVELAVAVGAEGVHLGRDDAGIASARQRLGPRAIIGASCYDRLDLACDAVAAGASYVAFGSFHPSPTKPGAVRASLTLLERARMQLNVPVCAIGGVTPENAPELIAAGADLLAVISAVFAAPDPAMAASRFAALIV